MFLKTFTKTLKIDDDAIFNNLNKYKVTNRMLFNIECSYYLKNMINLSNDCYRNFIIKLVLL